MPGELTKLSAKDRRAARQASAIPRRDDVLFVGLSPSGNVEGPRLASSIPSRVMTVVPRKKQPHLVAGLNTGTTFDVTRRPGAASFASTLGLATGDSTALARLLTDRRANEPGALASIARVWAAIEEKIRNDQGEAPARMIISGHSIGEEIGGDLGVLRADQLRSLSEIFPTAAGEVRHLHTSACKTDPTRVGRQWTLALPKLATVWGYEDAAPSTENGASAHEQRWEEFTRARDVFEIPASALDGLPASRNVRLWSAS